MFKVLTRLANDQWDDCWKVNGRKMRFRTREQAEVTIAEHIADYQEDIEDGELTMDDFKIEEIIKNASP